MNEPTIDQRLADLNSAVVQGKRTDAVEMVRTMLEDDIAPTRVLDAMVRAMEEVGRQFQCEEIFIPQMVVAAQAMSESMALLEPKLVAAGITPEYRVLIGTVAGDVHDIGKSLVSMMWKGAGFEVVDLGTNVPASKFLEAAQQQKFDLIGLSALLTTTMPVLKSTVEQLAPVQEQGVPIIVGGAPVTQIFADEIGANGYADDAVRAVDVARQLVGAGA